MTSCALIDSSNVLGDGGDWNGSGGDTTVVVGGGSWLPGSGGDASSSGGGFAIAAGGSSADGAGATGGAGTASGSGGLGSGGFGAGTSSGGTSAAGETSCSAPAWDENVSWTEYAAGDVRSHQGGEWSCTSPQWCFYEPGTSNGAYGWRWLADCESSSSSSGGAGTGGNGGSGGTSSSTGGSVGTGGSSTGGSVGTGGSSTGGSGGEDSCDGIADILTEDDFNAFFPNRNSTYTYTGMVAAVAGTGDLSGFPAFARDGSCETRRREVAAFLANVSRETARLVYVEEINKNNLYCDSSRSYGCPAGSYAYYGRGPMQLSWNYNYYAASMALFGDQRLLSTPSLVASDSAIAWATALWFWMTSSGAGSATCHESIAGDAGFGETIRTINGSLECSKGSSDANASSAVSQRVCYFEWFSGELGASVGGGSLNCGTNINRAAYCSDL